jgi:hypothetical protein
MVSAVRSMDFADTSVSVYECELPQPVEIKK